jgi:hypothetical protein
LRGAEPLITKNSWELSNCMSSLGQGV